MFKQAPVNSPITAFILNIVTIYSITAVARMYLQVTRMYCPAIWQQLPAKLQTA